MAKIQYQVVDNLTAGMSLRLITSDGASLRQVCGRYLADRENKCSIERCGSYCPLQREANNTILAQGTIDLSPSGYNLVLNWDHDVSATFISHVLAKKDYDFASSSDVDKLLAVLELIGELGEATWS